VFLHWAEGWDSFSGGGRRPKNLYLKAKLVLHRSETDPGRVTLDPGKHNLDPKRHVWGGASGWFSASYGPFRRFTGGDKDQEKLFYSNPTLARHLSIFSESVALSECLEWLKLLQYKTLEKDEEGKLLGPVTRSGIRLVELPLSRITRHIYRSTG
jgi:hypothetical protein